VRLTRSSPSPSACAACRRRALTSPTPVSRPKPNHTFLSAIPGQSSRCRAIARDFPVFMSHAVASDNQAETRPMRDCLPRRLVSTSLEPKLDAIMWAAVPVIFGG